MEDTKIQWAHNSWSPWVGCTRVSPGCALCYAETLMDKRYGRVKWGKGQPRSRTSKAYWRQPMRWDHAAEERGERIRVFPSLCDPFDHEVPGEWKNDFYNLIACTPNIDWLLLSKRHAEMLVELRNRFPGGCPSNIWPGVSVENQLWADRRIHFFRSVDAATKFVSYEPALENVSWAGWEFVSWMIVGGESGAGARPFHSSWAANALAFCKAEGVAFFMKQKGANSDLACKDAKGGDMSEWPEWCRVREFPDRPRLVAV